MGITAYRLFSVVIRGNIWRRRCVIKSVYDRSRWNFLSRGIDSTSLHCSKLFSTKLLNHLENARDIQSKKPKVASDLDNPKKSVRH